MTEDFEYLIEEIKKHQKYKKYDGKFPALSVLARFPEKNLPIIVEQGERLIANKNGNDFNEADLDFIKKQFISDIYQFLTKASLKINSTIVSSYGQSIIASNALYHIACSQQYKNRYADIDLNMNKVEFNFYSIPFVLRLAIESKLKGMIGFESCDVTRTIKGKKEILKGTREFPVNKILTYLSSNKLINCPCQFSDIKNIYSWSCRFTHDATKEYVWLRMKAIDMLKELFSFEHTEKINTSKTNTVNHLLPGITVDAIMKAINNDPQFKGHHKLHLSESQFEENTGFYNRATGTSH